VYSVEFHPMLNILEDEAVKQVKKMLVNTFGLVHTLIPMFNLMTSNNMHQAVKIILQDERFDPTYSEPGHTQTSNDKIIADPSEYQSSSKVQLCA